MVGGYGVTAEEREKDSMWRQLTGRVSTTARYRGEILAYQALGIAALSENRADIRDWRWPVDDAHIATVQVEDGASAAERYLEEEVFVRLDDPDDATYTLHMHRDEADDPRYRIGIRLPEEGTLRDARADTRLPDFIVDSKIPLDEDDAVEDLLSRYNIPVSD